MTTTRTAAVLALLLLLCGCASADAVFLKDAMGRMAQCGPFTKLLGNIPLENDAAEMRMRKCVSALEQQGYEVVAAPPENSAGSALN